MSTNKCLVLIPVLVGLSMVVSCCGLAGVAGVVIKERAAIQVLQRDADALGDMAATYNATLLDYQNSTAKTVELLEHTVASIKIFDQARSKKAAQLVAD